MAELTNEDIYSELKGQLEKNKLIKQPKAIVCFSGVPGSGKTTLATELEAKLNAVRISNDDIRRVIAKLGVSEKGRREEVKEMFLQWLFSELKSWPNGLLLLDSSIDRRYEALLSEFHGYKFFVISMVASRELAAKRLIAQEDHQSDHQKILDHLDSCLNDKRHFEEKHGRDIAYEINSDEARDPHLDAESITEMVQKRIEK